MNAAPRGIDSSDARGRVNTSAKLDSGRYIVRASVFRLLRRAGA
jgi:hypothetical protein